MLKLSKKWSYGLKAVVYVAKMSPDLVKIKEISASQDISEALLRRIIASLEKKSILKTIKWRAWWVILAKSLGNISVYDILDAVWEELWIVNCSKWLECWNKSVCLTTDIFWNLQKSFNAILKLQTLDKLLK